MLKKIFIIILLISLPACLPSSWNWGLKPRPFQGTKGFPDTSTFYGKGFRDGCSAGWKTTSKGLLGDIKVSFDAQMMENNRDYSTGWSNGYDHCVNIMDWELP